MALLAVLLWHGDDHLGSVDAVVLPGGFAHGDYLRPGALARFSPVMDAVGAFCPGRRVSVIGICNGFQVLTEAGLRCRGRSRRTGGSVSCASRRASLSPRRRRSSPPARGWATSSSSRSTTSRGTTPVTTRRCAVWLDEDRVVLRLRRQSERVGGRHRRHHERGGQRGRPHAAPRARQPRAARLGGRSRAVARPGRRGHGARRPPDPLGPGARETSAFCNTAALTPAARHVEYVMPLRSP